MGIFCLEALMEAENGDMIYAEHQSRLHYYSYCERSYWVLSDERTIIGVEKGNGEKVFVMEDLTNKDPYYKPFKMEFHNNDIDCILVNEKAKTILVGDRLGRLNQYSFDINKNIIEIQREYGLLDIGYIYSGVFIGKLAILGGNKTYSLRVVDTQKRMVFGSPLETAMFGLQSLQLCQVSDKKVYLAVCGVNPDYATSSDIFDVTELLKYHKVQIKKIEMASMSNLKKQKKHCSTDNCSSEGKHQPGSSNSIEYKCPFSDDSCWLCSSSCSSDEEHEH